MPLADGIGFVRPQNLMLVRIINKDRFGQRWPLSVFGLAIKLCRNLKINLLNQDGGAFQSVHLTGRVTAVGGHQ